MTLDLKTILLSVPNNVKSLIIAITKGDLYTLGND